MESCPSASTIFDYKFFLLVPYHMTQAETHYSTFDRELLAVCLVIKHFHHRSPTTNFALNTHSDRHSPRQVQQLDIFLNSLPLSSTSRVLIMWLLMLFRVCALMFCYLEKHPLWTSRSWPKLKLQTHRFDVVVEAISLANSRNPLYCDTSTGVQRPVIPLAWHRIVLDSLHSPSHPGIRALVTARFVWPGIIADVRQWNRACLQCQRTMIQRHSMAAFVSFPTPDARIDIVHVDLVGPLPLSQEFTYLLECVDHFTRWPEAILLTSISVESVAKVFLLLWIARYSVPSCIVTDRWRQFKSQL